MNPIRKVKNLIYAKLILNKKLHIKNKIEILLKYLLMRENRFDAFAQQKIVSERINEGTSNCQKFKEVICPPIQNLNEDKIYEFRSLGLI